MISRSTDWLVSCCLELTLFPFQDMMDDICQEQFLELSYLNGVPEPGRGRGVPVRGRGAAPPPPPPVPRYFSQKHRPGNAASRSELCCRMRLSYLFSHIVGLDLGFWPRLLALCRKLAFSKLASSGSCVWRCNLAR